MLSKKINRKEGVGVGVRRHRCSCCIAAASAVAAASAAATPTPAIVCPSLHLIHMCPPLFVRTRLVCLCPPSPSFVCVSCVVYVCPHRPSCIRASACACLYAPAFVLARMRPSFVRAGPCFSRSFALVRARSFVFVCPFVLIPATRSYPLGLRLAFVCAHLG